MTIYNHICMDIYIYIYLCTCIVYQFCLRVFFQPWWCHVHQSAPCFNVFPSPETPPNEPGTGNQRRNLAGEVDFYGRSDAKRAPRVSPGFRTEDGCGDGSPSGSPTGSRNRYRSFHRSFGPKISMFSVRRSTCAFGVLD